MSITSETRQLTDHELADALGVRLCDLGAVRDLVRGTSTGDVAPPLRLRDLLHRRLRLAACDDMIGPRALQASLPRLPERPTAGLPLIDLPDPEPLPPTSLADVIDRRHSSTTFGPDQVPLPTLAALLEGAAGIREHRPGYNTRDFPVRRAPSAGGLAPIDLYLAANAVDGLAQGLYYYRPTTRQLALVDNGNVRGKVADAGVFVDWLYYAPVVFFLAVNMPRVDWKYGVRSYRYVHVDLGVLTQNLYLVATALGLATCAVAAFDDDEANDLLRLDGRDEYVSLLFACGPPGGLR
jgi:SagB-type dehydrogenase family enzyme